MMNNGNPFELETRLEGCLIENYDVMEVDFNAVFPTWILAYCPDINGWFTTDHRFFYYEYPKEFENESDAVTYFKDHIDEFFELNKEMYPKRFDDIWLEHSSAVLRVKKPVTDAGDKERT